MTPHLLACSLGAADALWAVPHGMAASQSRVAVRQRAWLWSENSEGEAGGIPALPLANCILLIPLGMAVNVPAVDPVVVARINIRPVDRIPGPAAGLGVIHEGQGVMRATGVCGVADAVSDADGVRGVVNELFTAADFPRPGYDRGVVPDTPATPDVPPVAVQPVHTVAALGHGVVLEVMGCVGRALEDLKVPHVGLHRPVPPVGIR